MSSTMRGSGPLAAIALALVAGLAVAAFLPRGGGAGEVPVVTVARAPFVQQVVAEGNLSAVRATPVTIPPGAPDSLTISWLAPDGVLVHAGDPIARFDPHQIEISLRTAQDALATERVKAEKERAQSDAEMKKLAGDGEIADRELEAARRFQKKDEMIFSRSERIESEIDGDLARQRSDHAAGAAQTRRALSAAERQLIDIQRRQAAANIARARQALASLTVTAPYDGILLLRRNWRREPIRVGDTVFPGQPLADLPDLSRFQAEVYVLEADAGGLAVGKPAAVTLESAPGIVYPATLSRIDTLAKPRFRGSPVQYFAVDLALAKLDPARMKPGARVTARLVLDRLEGALAVPREAVFEREGRSIVYRRSAAGSKASLLSGFEPVPVVLGPAGMGRVVIRSGVAPGDVLALRDPGRPASAPGGGGAAGSGGAPGGARSGA